MGEFDCVPFRGSILNILKFGKLLGILDRGI